MVPSVLGLQKSFGFGDRLGLATSGHLAAARKFDFAPIFAQQSIREMARTQRTPDQVMRAAKDALQNAAFASTWGADADHLKTPEDVDVTAQAGFTFFTIDPSAGVQNRADAMSESELAAEIEAQEDNGLWRDMSDRDSYWRYYLNQKTHHLGDLRFEFSRETLWRAIAKYGHALGIAADLAAYIKRVKGETPFEIEVSVDETDSPTSPLEHFFIRRELWRRGVENLVSLAPRFVGEMEKGVDYKGDLLRFEAELAQHAAIARGAGMQPYKISVHSGSDKFSIYPIVGRVCGDLLHVKTAGTSYLEALRCVVQSDERLFRDVARFCHDHFETDRATYHISATSAFNRELVQASLTGAALEEAYLNDDRGRQILHVTFGSVLTHPELKPRLLANLEANALLYTQLLETHFTKHLAALTAG
jgi:hypothetical protein